MTFNYVEKKTVLIQERFLFFTVFIFFFLKKLHTPSPEPP